MSGALTNSAFAVGGVDVYAGYADTLRPLPTNFPTPWDGSPGVTFNGCAPTAACAYDAGAVRVGNASGSPVTVNSIVIHFGPSCTYDIWSHNVPLGPGAQLIVTQTTSGADDGCTPANGHMDSSDIGPGGGGWAGHCDQSGIIPTVDVTVDGVTSMHVDHGQILNTFGIDYVDCPPGNESLQWTPIGNAPCAGATLSLAPPTQTRDLGDPATIIATFVNGCGDPLSNTIVDFRVTGGPNAGATGSATTDADGHTAFTYTSVSEGADTVTASVTNPAGRIPSDGVSVTWLDPRITATGVHIDAVEGAPFHGAVAHMTDPDADATASEYSATVDWGDGQSSASTVSGPAGGPFTVSGSHTYEEEGAYLVAVHAVDDDNPANSADASSTAAVADAPLTAACAASATSLQAFSGTTASFSDADPHGTASDYTVTIDWGDGSQTTAGTVRGTQPFTAAGTHTYAATGPVTIRTDVQDAGGSHATATCSVIVYAFAPGGGAFVVGDRSDANSAAVTFWGAQWWKLNSLSGGTAPPAFKGFALNPASPSCGRAWSTDPGNSAPPPDGPLPAYMGVIVASTTTKSGATISGDTIRIVVLRTAAGYRSDPGHAGAGTVVARVC